ncbi:MAG TPA: ferrochelatase [Pyrinomonadaceae bacterium]|jgi:ferrochelatase|nr:ferrochelatase [Pyrinomonadaceae bacterium]
MNPSQTPDSELQTADRYDALLVVSFGGPEGMNDVMPFLEKVLRGRNVPRERMLGVAKHYELFGGVSPINEQNRNLIRALRRELEANGPQLPIYFGNRNWHPLLEETLREMRDDGVKNALAFVTSAYSSYSSCRQYLEDIERARASVGADAPHVEKLRAFYNHPGFIEANVANVRVALEQIPEASREDARIVFTAHSIPETMAKNCDYEVQLQEAARLVFEGAAEAGAAPLAHGELTRAWEPTPLAYKLVFQSRSGSPAQPWRGPDICDYLREVRTNGVEHVVVAPIGFVSDHMEIVYDLDTEAAALCRELGLNMVRAATAGTHPAFVSMIRELILERVDSKTPRRSLGSDGPRSDVCLPGCCIIR